ncbi:ABC transporter permease [Hymenobacter sp. BT559]|uniref:ABC transporter permease n=1 Tax=Hymenobacter sp. BT559 TaxID=2795729 RepID=UPI0018EAC6D2|nr:ABC transporter permease [Hymenobacter sp. BT559]MBJ6143713.1 ABC transporter permease [Hymenobacter sp. BT559]
MLRHLFTLMWNRRRANALLIIEILLAFVVLFAVGTIGAGLWANYRQPLGFEYNQAWQVNLAFGSQPRAERFGTLQQVLGRLRALPGVQGVAVSAANTPFSFNDSQMSVEKTDAQGRVVHSAETVNIFNVGPELRQVMNLNMMAGRWFEPADVAPSAHGPIVIDERLREAFFPSNEQAVGKLLSFDKKQWRVVGVMQAYRADGELQDPVPAVVQPVFAADTTFLPDALLLRVAAGSGAALEKRLTDEIRRIGPGWSATVRTLPEMHASQVKTLLTKPVLLSVMSIFLLLNMALGLFGVLWLNISQRRAELGVRRALGATAGAISRLVVGETLVVTTFGLVLGLLIAVQFPLLGAFEVPAGVYLTAMGLAAVGLYGLAAVCALYPGRLAAGIRPAVALREE